MHCRRVLSAFVAAAAALVAMPSVVRANPSWALMTSVGQWCEMLTVGWILSAAATVFIEVRLVTGWGTAKPGKRSTWTVIAANVISYLPMPILMSLADSYSPEAVAHSTPGLAQRIMSTLDPSQPVAAIVTTLVFTGMAIAIELPVVVGLLSKRSTSRRRLAQSVAIGNMLTTAVSIAAVLALDALTA